MNPSIRKDVEKMLGIAPSSSVRPTSVRLDATVVVTADPFPRNNDA